MRSGDGGHTSNAVCEAVCRWILRRELVFHRRGEQKCPHQLQVTVIRSDLNSKQLSC